MSNLNITGTRILNEILKCDKRIIVNQGGTRSSKTWSIAQANIIDFIKQRGIVIDVIRKTLPALKATAMKDVIDLLRLYGIYDESKHNLSDGVYQDFGNEIAFYSLDDTKKVHGRKRTHLWCNEANEFTFEDWRQLILRTSNRAYLDYNPSDEFSWIYDHVLPREDCHLIKSTYLDNPFLEKEIVEEIERLKEEDSNYWTIYGLGERAKSPIKIYHNWDISKTWPEEFDEIVLGMDFGFNNPSALIKAGILDGEFYLSELIYERGLTNKDIIDRMKNIEVNPTWNIYGDPTEKQHVEEIFQAGFNIRMGEKDVHDGIDFVQRKKLHIHPEAVNLIKELQSYSWKQDKAGNILDEPIKMNDHACDAIRYLVYSHQFKYSHNVAVI